ncbi:MAG: hypothetical protein NVSMB1_07480 [Polyangiales bacterium]
MSASPHVPRKARWHAPRQREAARRSEERGATLFVVLMILMILTAIGTFAANNARFENQVAGFERQRNVTQEVVSFGAYATMSEIGSAPQAYSDLVAQSGSTNAAQKERCAANAGLGGSATPWPCYHLYLRDIEQRLNYVGLIAQPDPTSGVPGSLGLGAMTGSVAGGMNGGFVAEITEPFEYVRPMPGYPIDGRSGTPIFVDFTVTSNGYVFYDANLNRQIDPTERGGSTFANGRGHVVIGPILKR